MRSVGGFANGERDAAGSDEKAKDEEDGGDDKTLASYGGHWLTIVGAEWPNRPSDARTHLRTV